MLKKLLFLVLAFGLALPLKIVAQEEYDNTSSLTEEYRQESIERQKIKEADWKKAIRGLDYQSKPDQTPKSSREIIGGNGRKLMTIIAVIAGAGLIAFLIAYFLGLYSIWEKRSRETDGYLY